MGDVHSNCYNGIFFIVDIHLTSNVGFGKAIAKTDGNCCDKLVIRLRGIGMTVCNTSAFWQMEGRVNDAF